MDVRVALESIGLTKQEAAVYTTTLQLGVAKASTIAQKAHVAREAVYYTLTLLRERGFVSEVIKSGVRYYSAAAPKRILELIDEERQRKIDAMQGVLPSLEALQTTAFTRPTIEVYEGVEGFKTITNKLLEQPNAALSCYLAPSILEFLPHFHPQFRRRRAEQNIRIRTITQRTPLLDEVRALDKKELRETRYLNGVVLDTDVLYYILPDAVLIIKANAHEQLGVYIKEPQLAQLQQQVFDLLWQQAA